MVWSWDGTKLIPIDLGLIPKYCLFFPIGSQSRGVVQFCRQRNLDERKEILKERQRNLDERKEILKERQRILNVRKEIQEERREILEERRMILRGRR